MPHKVTHCSYAAPCLRPSWIKPIKRRVGAKAAGQRFEKKLAQALPKGWLWGQWFHFLDLDGPHWCQPDFIKAGKKTTVVLECKLSYIDGAQDQINKLYRPILEKAFGNPVLGIVVTQHLRPGNLPIVCDSLENAMLVASVTNINPILHWLGNTRL